MFFVEIRREQAESVSQTPYLFAGNVSYRLDSDNVLKELKIALVFQEGFYCPSRLSVMDVFTNHVRKRRGGRFSCLRSLVYPYTPYASQKAVKALCGLPLSDKACAGKGEYLKDIGEQTGR
jgi:hypothetical protein